MFSTSTLKRLVAIVGSTAIVGVVLVGWYLLGADGLPNLVVLPTAMGVISAMQAIKSESQRYRRRWSLIFITSGILISGGILWQQRTAERRASAERKQMQDQIKSIREDVIRSLFKIEDVFVSFKINVPMDHPTLQGYRERMERCAEEIVKSQSYKCGAAPHTVDTASKNPIKDFSLGIGTEIYPDKQKEAIAYVLLDYVAVDVRLFKDNKPTIEQVGSPDLRFRITKMLDSPQNHNASNNTAYVGLYHEVGSQSIVLEGNRVPVNDQTWKTNGKIASLSDLQSAFLTVHPDISLVSLTIRGDSGTEDRRFTFTQEWLAANEIAKTASLTELTLYVSRGYEFQLTKGRLDKLGSDKYGHPVYLAKLVD